MNTKRNEFEVISHRKIKHINIIVNKINYRSFHMHNDFELIIVLSGTGLIRTARKTYRVAEGSIVILNSFEMHEIDAGDEGIEVLIYQISNHFLREYAPYFRFAVFEDNWVDGYFTNEQTDNFVAMAIHGAKVFFGGDGLYELECVSTIAKMVRMLLCYCPTLTLSEKDYHQKKRGAQRIDRIYSYIDENYNTSIRLTDVAESEGISSTHLSHLFTSTFGESFQEYVNNLRFEHALRIIGESKLSLREVAEQSGFSDPKYMTKMFENKLGIMPKDYRHSLLSKPSKGPGKNSPLERIYSDEEALELFRKINENK